MKQVVKQKLTPENKFDTGDLFTNGQNHRGKTTPGEFKLTTSENPLLSQQPVTSKGIPVPYTNLQLTLTPISNWTFSVVTISPCNARLPVCD